MIIHPLVAPILAEVVSANPGEPEFHQAAEEVLQTLVPILEKERKYLKEKIPQRMLVPERTIEFRVVWQTDNGEVQVNRGYRVQMNSAIGPYKGGLRFHPNVNRGVLKFLAFEQVFKNALSGLPLGGGKGGSDFDPKGKSDAEIMRFCQAFMLELERHLDHRRDIPAGDIGVGAREIGYMFGMYKKIRNEFTGVLTGKGLGWGGSLLRPEATGYGLVYFAADMLHTKGDSLKGKTCLVSGSGNVSQFAIEKLLELAAKVITFSDSDGFIYDKDGITYEKLAYLKWLKNEKRGRVSEYAEKYPSAEYHPVARNARQNLLWAIPADCAFPCATQNEILENDAMALVQNGVRLLAEGANMPTNNAAIEILQKNGVMYAPGKAANAGGVATSGLEMTQNYSGEYWTREQVDQKLQAIMRHIHDTCLAVANEFGAPGNYVIGANIGGFRRVADAMIAQGMI